MNDKKILKIIVALSVFVFLVILILNRKLITPPLDYPPFINQLPLLNACINTICSVLLIASYYQIKKKKVSIHKRLNLFAFVLSSVFLISYLVYHFFAPETHFGGEGLIKYVYYFILITHILLSVFVFPLIFLSFYFGLTGKIEKHRKLSKFSLPIWLYVTVTGVLVYLLISPYYLHHV